MKALNVKRLFHVLALSATLVGSTSTTWAADRVVIDENQLKIDGQAQPQLFGAELQYFRLRGGYGRNIPREKVLQLWAQAMDRMVQAGMNAVSFYIPWDFHEYAEGQFDFTGTADEDGDGQADYPSRDVITFMRMLKERGLNKMMARPGPYINAEWGFLGFGAIPEWFHHKYPQSHMQTHWGWNLKLYDYHNEKFLYHTQLWFEALYEQVLKSEIGGKGSVLFLQIDNETNFQWNSIYVGDYSAATQARYRDFLKQLYDGDLKTLNRYHRTYWASWNDVRAPRQYGQNTAEDRDWYRFQDENIRSYLEKIRRIWEAIGVREPQVIFTLAESYNAPDKGVLPHYLHRNDPGRTGLMTVNLYPKTYETHDKALLNGPFKADLDVKAADEANDHYLGSKQEWVLGPEIQGGWWRGIDVTAASRQQTYLTVLGHGMKSIFIYYFNEGNNWGVEWGQERIRPLFEKLRQEWKVTDIPVHELSNEFWGELQAQSDRLILMGYDVRRLMQTSVHEDENLFFDAPLDGDAQPRDHYFELAGIGNRVIAPHQDFLARSLSVYDGVALVKDAESHLPSFDTAVSSGLISAEWAGALLGYVMNASYNPRVLIGEISHEHDFQDNNLVHLGNGSAASRTLHMLKTSFDAGRTVVNFLSSQAAKELGFAVPSKKIEIYNQSMSFYLNGYGQLVEKPTQNKDAVTEHVIRNVSHLTVYDSKALAERGCSPTLYWGDDVVGYTCRNTLGGKFHQVGALFFADYNSSLYHDLSEAPARRLFLESALNSRRTPPLLQLPTSVEKTVVFARHDPKKEKLWVTLKTGRREAQDFAVRVQQEVLFLLDSKGPSARFVVQNILTETTEVLTSEELLRKGFAVSLPAEGSAVFVITPQK